MRMSCHLIPQEEDWFCVPEMNVFWGETCVSTLKTKAKEKEETPLSEEDVTLKT